MTTRPNYEQWMQLDQWLLRDAALLLSGIEPSTAPSHVYRFPTHVFYVNMDPELYSKADAAIRFGDLPAKEVLADDSAVIDYVVDATRILRWAMEQNFEIPTPLKACVKAVEDGANSISTRIQQGRLHWEDIEIEVQEARVAIRERSGGPWQFISALELGLERHDNAFPKVSWHVLQLFARNGGVVENGMSVEMAGAVFGSDGIPRSRAKMLNKDHVRQLKRALCSYFQLRDSPIVRCQKHWRTRFNICCRN